MQQSTKQRIVGTVVLLALALIFLPIIFDGRGSYQTPISSRIPEPPEVQVLAEPIPSRPVIIADALESEESGQEEGTETLIDDSDPTDLQESVAITATDSGADPEELTNPGGAEVVTSEPTFTRGAPQLSESGLPQGWSVRLGSFSDVDNANNLLQRLLDAGYRAYTRSISSERGDLTGVFVGPWVDRQRVSEYQQELQSAFQLAGIVVPYEI